MSIICLRALTTFRFKLIQELTFRAKRSRSPGNRMLGSNNIKIYVYCMFAAWNRHRNWFKSNGNTKKRNINGYTIFVFCVLFSAFIQLETMSSRRKIIVKLFCAKSSGRAFKFSGVHCRLEQKKGGRHSKLLRFQRTLS